MGMASGGGAKADTPTYQTKGEKLTRALVIEEVKIIEVPRRIEVPVYEEKKIEQTRWVTKEEPQIKYVTKELDTVKFNVQEKDTTKFNVKEEETIKYVPTIVKVEKPVFVDKPYERPVISEKVFEVATVKDLSLVRQLIDMVADMSKELELLKKHLDVLTNYKLVEKIIEVPKLVWVNTPVERIVWKDVERKV